MIFYAVSKLTPFLVTEAHWILIVSELVAVDLPRAIVFFYMKRKGFSLFGRKAMWLIRAFTIPILVIIGAADQLYFNGATSISIIIKTVLDIYFVFVIRSFAALSREQEIALEHLRATGGLP